MKMIYIDESDGSFEKNASNSDYLVVTAVIVDSEIVPRFDSIIKKFRDKHLNGDRLKVIRRPDSTTPLDYKIKMVTSLFEELSFAKKEDFWIISAILGKYSCSNNSREENLFTGFKLVIERAFMEISNNVDMVNTAMVFIDRHNKNEIKKFTEEIYTYINNEEKKEGKLSETISHYPAVCVENNIIDIADLVAYSINIASKRFFRVYNHLKRHEDELRHYNKDFLPIYWNRFCVNSNNQVSGFGIKYWD